MNKYLGWFPLIGLIAGFAYFLGTQEFDNNLRYRAWYKKCTTSQGHVLRLSLDILCLDVRNGIISKYEKP